MSLWSKLRAMLGRTAPAPAVPDPIAPPAPPASTATVAATPTDPYAAGKDNLRSLSKGLMAAGGAIAAVLVAGSQLASIGGLDDSSTVALFGWHQTRFEFAVVGLGVSLAAITLAVALVAWVQTTSFMTLDALCRYPLASRWKPWGWGVNARVRQTVEADLGRRGAEKPADRTYVVFAAERWAAARRLEHERRAPLIAVTEAVQRRHMPLAPPVGTWTDSAKLLMVAQTILADPATATTASPSALQALDALLGQLTTAYKDADDEAAYRFQLVQRILDDASYLRIKFAFSMVLKYVVLALAVAGVGIGMFAWATHPPKSEQGQPGVLIVPIGPGAAPTQHTSFTNCDASTLQVNAQAPGFLVFSAASSSSNKPCVISARP